MAPSLVLKRQHCFRRMICPIQPPTPEKRPLRPSRESVSPFVAPLSRGREEAALMGGRRGRLLLRSSSLETMERGPSGWPHNGIRKSDHGDDNTTSRPNCETKTKEEVLKIICQGIRLEPETKAEVKADNEIQIISDLSDTEPNATQDQKDEDEVEKGGHLENQIRLTDIEDTEGLEEKDLPLTIENVAYFRQYAPEQSLTSDTNQSLPSHQSGPEGEDGQGQQVPFGNEDQDHQDPVVEANSESPREQEEEGEEDPDEEEGEKNGKEKKAKERIGFRERKVIEYENRIRNFSTPDKIFRYFATYRSIQSDGEIYMTPGDFLRSLTPGALQPVGLGLDQFRKFDPAVGASGVEDDLDPSSIFYHLGAHGLISFSDYVFLLTILSTSRDHGNTGSTLKKTNTALSNYFFGSDRQGKLTIDRFLAFQTHLQRDILAMEFSRKDPVHENGNISEKQFAELLLTYANYAPKKRTSTLKRVKKTFKPTEECQYPGISLEEYINIFYLLMHIEDVEKALCFHNLAGASIDQRTLKHVAKVTADVDLSEHVVNVIFTIFDEDGDGGLSNREFVAVMKNKLKRGLEKPKDTGFMNFFTAVTKCALTVKAKVP
ncbi:hypothetical protein TCAL_06778 [Tigriopus californicus]|uniref:EF-hand domain-containing protein n=1 Tax=Tigriopus californicus TaxID=6832 RepID=A0A553PQV4_TIGCA|nr:hypothetical protein TCAL_06778 [Tigriopus californicus]